MNGIKLEKYPVEDLSLYSGEILEREVVILVSGERMAVTSDFGPDDPWRNKEDVDLPYFYKPLNLSKFTNLEKVW